LQKRGKKNVKRKKVRKERGRLGPVKTIGLIYGFSKKMSSLKSPAQISSAQLV
jgi:hypothetical protein